MKINLKEVMPHSEGAHPILLIEDAETKELILKAEGTEAQKITQELTEKYSISEMEWQCIIGGIASAPREGKTYRVVWTY